MQKFLIIQLRPEDATADNEFEAFLRRGGLAPEDVQRVRIEQAPLPAINLDEYAAIIVGGSPFDVSKADSEKSELQKRVEADFDRLLTEVIARDFPFLGACSGCGLLGKQCGAVISGRFAEPVGGIDVTLTEAGVNDPLLADCPREFRALVGHKEAPEAVPEGAVLLATSKAAPVQMFRIGENVYATQFHPEADADVFAVRIDVYKNHGYFPAEEAAALLDRVSSEDAPIPHQILKNFVDRYRAT